MLIQSNLQCSEIQENQGYFWLYRKGRIRQLLIKLARRCIDAIGRRQKCFPNPVRMLNRFADDVFGFLKWNFLFFVLRQKMTPVLNANFGPIWVNGASPVLLRCTGLGDMFPFRALPAPESL